jgi:hypothetical protein
MSKLGFFIGFLLTFGGVGGVEAAQDTLTLMLAVMVSLIGITVMLENRDAL